MVLARSHLLSSLKQHGEQTANKAANYTLSEVKKMCPFMKNCGSLSSQQLEKHANFCPVVSHLQVPLQIKNDEGETVGMEPSKGLNPAGVNQSRSSSMIPDEGVQPDSQALKQAMSKCPFSAGAAQGTCGGEAARPMSPATFGDLGNSIHPKLSEHDASKLVAELGDTAQKCPFFAGLTDLKQQSYEHKFFTAIQQLHHEGRYRSFANLQRECGNFPMAKFRPPSSLPVVTHSSVDQATGDSEHIPVRVFCSNDYLGMGQNPTVLTAAHEAIDASGMGAGGTRNISGTTKYHVDLELELAHLHGKEKALVCSSGFVANEASLQIMSKMLPNCVIFSDADNHASMIDGIRQSKLKKHIWRHNDMAHLEELLQSYPVEHPKMIVFESVYSMSGSLAPLHEIVRLAKLYNALTFVDEVHAVGMYGKHGAGLAQEQGLQGEIDIITGTLGKAFGAFGGYIAGSSAYIDCVRSYASSFIFTTALPPVVAAGALASVRYLKDAGEPCMNAAIKSVEQRLGETPTKPFSIPAEPTEADRAAAAQGCPHHSAKCAAYDAVVPTEADRQAASAGCPHHSAKVSKYDAAIAAKEAESAVDERSQWEVLESSAAKTQGTGTICRQLQRERVSFLKQNLIDSDLPFIDNRSHIVPVFVGDPVKCKQLTDNLLYQHQIYIQPINYPTVPVNKERIRITPGPLHSEADMADLVRCLNEEWIKLGLPRRSELFAEGRAVRSAGAEAAENKVSGTNYLETIPPGCEPTDHTAEPITPRFEEVRQVQMAM